MTTMAKKRDQDNDSDDLKTNKDDRIVKMSEACEMLGFTPPRLRRWIDAGAIDAEWTDDKTVWGVRLSTIHAMIRASREIADRKRQRIEAEMKEKNQ
jgi:hypothetical protein